MPHEHIWCLFRSNVSLWLSRRTYTELVIASTIILLLTLVYRLSRQIGLMAGSRIFLLLCFGRFSVCSSWSVWPFSSSSIVSELSRISRRNERHHGVRAQFYQHVELQLRKGCSAWPELHLVRWLFHYLKRSPLSHRFSMLHLWPGVIHPISTGHFTL